MNAFKVLQWTSGLWLAVLILVACNRVAPARLSNTSVPTLSAIRLLAMTPTPLAPSSTPTNSTLPTSTPPPPPTTPLPSPDTPTPLPVPSTDTSPANEVEPGPMNEPFEVNFVQAQPNPYWQTYTRTDGVQHYATNLVIDNTGRKWLGGLTGLTVFDGQSWQHYTGASGLLYENVSILAQDLAGNIWVGYSGGGLSRLAPSADGGFDGQHWQHFSLATDAVGNTVIDLAADRAGRLWFSTSFDLGLFDGQSWTLYRTEADRAGLPSPTVEPPPQAPLIQPQVVNIGPEHPAYYGVSGLAADPFGPVWITNRQGLARFDGQQWQQYVFEGNYGNSKPMIVNAANGQVWGAYSSGGVSVFDGQNRRIHNQLNGLPRDGVYAIAADPAGRVWFGSNAGVTVFDGQTWLTYTPADGLPSGPISGIAVDPAGHIWLVTTTGVLAEFTPPAAPAPLPTPVAQVVPRILDFRITPTTALTAGDIISVTWQAVGDQAELCLLSGTPNFCQPAPVSGSRVITVDETLLNWAISGIWLKVATNDDFTGISGLLDFQCRYKWFYDDPLAGCPAAPPIYSRAAAQYFERGLMIWSEQPDRFYVFFDKDHQFTWFDAEWVKEPNFLSTPEPLPTPTGVVPTPAPWPTAPPPGAFELVSGFGRVWQHFWRYDEYGRPVTVRQDIGWATGPEFEFETVYQCALGTAAYGRWGCSLRSPTGTVLGFAPQSTVRDKWVWGEKE